MNSDNQINLQIVAQVARALGDLNIEVVYIGGANIRIYAKEEGAALPRVITNVDKGVQVSSTGEMETLQRINQL